MERVSAEVHAKIRPVRSFQRSEHSPHAKGTDALETCQLSGRIVMNPRIFSGAQSVLFTASQTFVARNISRLGSPVKSV